MQEQYDLAELRRQIDRVDEQLVQLLNERARLSLQAGIAKNWKDIYRPEREKQVVSHVTSVSNGPLSNEAVTEIFQKIIEICRAIQRNK
ncbi:MAG TPA: chorismate mutase [Candidatus Saccharimonadales bacterium]|jgi:chorismate mutase/prephenate dehydratase|nr:chorismate mutase [Candidatus Saccharimonadales bacterium]